MSALSVVQSSLSTLRRPALGLCLGVLAAATLALAGEAHAQSREVNFRFAPPYWYSALGVPDDWHKSLASDEGELLYDFGPGPYVIPLTRVGIGVRGAELTREHQRLGDPRVPVVSTTLAGPDARIDLTTFAVVPEEASPSNGRFESYERLDGISGALGWAQPNVPADSAFQHVAWGITRPIHYRLRTAPGAKKRIVLGFAESYKPRLNERVAWMQVEGAPDQTVDLALTARRNDPQVFVFEAADEDGDGWIGVEVLAREGADPNTTLAAIWMYPEGAYFTRDDLIAGTGGTPPELRIDAGTEMLRQASRVDVIDAAVQASGEAVPVVTVQTRRSLVARDGALWLGKRPFVATEPAFTSADTTAEGWVLALPTGTREARVLVFSGDAGASDLSRTRATSTEALLAASAAFWAGADIPYGRVRVPDAGIQAVLDMGLRTLYQGRETVGGRGQFNASFTLYRGLWTGDAAYFIDLATVLGDRARAREALEGILAHQTPEGLIEVMKPFTFWRESAMTAWTFARYARLVGDDPVERAFLDQHWPAVMRVVEALRRARQTTVGMGEPYEGLFPPAFNDGGIGQISAEYSSVLWMMTALHELGRVARTQNRTDDAARLDAFYTELRTSFDAAFQRDARRDAHGHLYLPVPVGKTGPDEIPQLAQWAALEAHLFSDYLPLDGAYLAGTLGIMVESSSLLTRFLEGADGRFEVVVKPLPIMAEPEDVYFPTGGSALVMLTEDEAKQEAAWRYMMFATGPEGAKIIVENTGFAPTNALVVEDEAYLADFYEANPMHRPAHEQVARFAGPWYAFPGAEGVAVTDLIAAAMVEVSDGGADPEATVRELADTMRARLGMQQ